MAQQNVCGHFKFGFCKYKESCRKKHIKEICENSSCVIKICNLRHPKICKFYREFGRCKFTDGCAFKHIVFDNILAKRVDNLEKKLNEKDKQIKQLTDSQNDIKQRLAEKENDFEKLNKMMNEMLLKVENLVEENNLTKESDFDKDILEKTFANPFSKVTCDLCGYVAKDSRGLKIHERRKHTHPINSTQVEETVQKKKKKYPCDLCEFETNNKKMFNMHKASSCLKVINCEHCAESFESEMELDEHMRLVHNASKYKCDTCDFASYNKKFFSDHKASSCSVVVLCEFSCGECFESEEEMNKHTQTFHNW